MIFKKYRRKGFSELADWSPEVDMTGVSVSEEDRRNGSPKLGDKIARNPVNHADKLLVAEQYVKENLELVEPNTTSNS